MVQFFFSVMSVNPPACLQHSLERVPPPQLLTRVAGGLHAVRPPVLPVPVAEPAVEQVASRVRALEGKPAIIPAKTLLAGLLPEEFRLGKKEALGIGASDEPGP